MPRLRREAPAPRPRRTHLFKCWLSDDEQRTLLARAQGYPSPAEYGRRRLVASRALPIHRLGIVTDAFIPIQLAIDRAAEAGHIAAAVEATEALRRVLRAVTDP